MKKLTNTLSIAILSAALFATVPARAQNVDNASANQSGVADVDHDDDDDSGKWGWLGLLGLLGLYGLKRKDNDIRHNRPADTNVNR
jgi:MYXO-CTERM domain-containing protein